MKPKILSTLSPSNPWKARLLITAALCSAMPLAARAADSVALAPKPTRLATTEVLSSARADMQSMDGVVEPIRQATLSVFKWFETDGLIS